MKKLLLSVTALIAASSAMAQQYDLEAILTTPTEGATVVASSSTTLAYDIKNNGPAPVASGDTLWMSYVVGTTIYDLDGTPNGTSGAILPVAFPAGVTLTSTMLGTSVTIDLSGITTNTNVCALVIGTNGAVSEEEDSRDANNANNISCFVATPAPLSLDEEASVVASVYPNPASDVLNIKSAEVVSSVTIVTMDGKVLSTGSSTSVDISELSAGTYAYIINTVSGRTAIGNFTKN